MRKVLAFALLGVGLVLMGTITTGNVQKPNGMVIVNLTGTTDLAAAAVDTLTFDASSFAVFPDVTDDELEFKIKVQPLLTVGDSCSVNYDVSIDGTNWGVALSSQVYTGVTPDDEELGTWGRYVRMRVTNNDVTAITPGFVIASARNQ